MTLTPDEQQMIAEFLANGGEVTQLPRERGHGVPDGSGRGTWLGREVRLRPAYLLRRSGPSGRRGSTGCGGRRCVSAPR
jgi:hypothetical protein